MFWQHYLKIGKEDLPPLYSRIFFSCHYRILKNSNLLPSRQMFLRRFHEVSHLYGNKIHATELSAASHVICECCQNVTCNFTETVNNHGLKRGAVCQIVKSISNFSLKLYIQF